METEAKVEGGAAPTVSPPDVVASAEVEKPKEVPAAAPTSAGDSPAPKDEPKKSAKVGFIS